jgi:hypothetical protein
MKCLTRETLQRYIDGELDGAERQTTERHLEQCSACSARVDVLRSEIAILHQHIARLTPEAPPVPGFVSPQRRHAGARVRWTDIAATIPFWLHKHWKPVLPACLVLGLIIVFGLTKDGHREVWPVVYDEWQAAGLGRNPNELWHERQLIITVDDIRTGTRTRITTSTINENITSESYPIPSLTGHGDSQNSGG